MGRDGAPGVGFSSVAGSGSLCLLRWVSVLDEVGCRLVRLGREVEWLSTDSRVFRRWCRLGWVADVVAAWRIAGRWCGWLRTATGLWVGGGIA